MLFDVIFMASGWAVAVYAFVKYAGRQYEATRDAFHDGYDAGWDAANAWKLTDVEYEVIE